LFAAPGRFSTKNWPLRRRDSQSAISRATTSTAPARSST
jgi:hypothetical protein